MITTRLTEMNWHNSKQNNEYKYVLFTKIKEYVLKLLYSVNAHLDLGLRIKIYSSLYPKDLHIKQNICIYNPLFYTAQQAGKPVS